MRWRDSKKVVKSDCRCQWGQRIFEVGVPEGVCTGKRDDTGKQEE